MFIYFVKKKANITKNKVKHETKRERQESLCFNKRDIFHPWMVRNSIYSVEINLFFENGNFILKEILFGLNFVLFSYVGSSFFAFVALVCVCVHVGGGGRGGYKMYIVFFCKGLMYNICEQFCGCRSAQRNDHLVYLNYEEFTFSTDRYKCTSLIFLTDMTSTSHDK